MADKFDLTINDLFVSDKFSKCWKDKTPQQFSKKKKTSLDRSEGTFLISTFQLKIQKRFFRRFAVSHWRILFSAMKVWMNILN